MFIAMATPATIPAALPAVILPLPVFAPYKKNLQFQVVKQNNIRLDEST